MPSILLDLAEPGMAGLLYFFYFFIFPYVLFFKVNSIVLNPHAGRALDLVIPNKTLIGFTGSAFGGGYGDPRSQFWSLLRCQAERLLLPSHPSLLLSG